MVAFNQYLHKKMLGEGGRETIWFQLAIFNTILLAQIILAAEQTNIGNTTKNYKVTTNTYKIKT